MMEVLYTLEGMKQCAVASEIVLTYAFVTVGALWLLVFLCHTRHAPPSML